MTAISKATYVQITTWFLDTPFHEVFSKKRVLLLFIGWLWPGKSWGCYQVHFFSPFPPSNVRILVFFLGSPFLECGLTVSVAAYQQHAL